jgi:hypothetical protein
LGLQKKIIVGFFNYLLESIKIGPTFASAQMPHHKGAKQNTIGVTKEISVKLPHYRGLVLTYRKENEMSFGHHVVE